MKSIWNFLVVWAEAINRGRQANILLKSQKEKAAIDLISK